MDGLRSQSEPHLLTIMNAVENASRVPITPAAILAILAGDGGLPSHVRVVFSDVSFRALEAAGAASGIDAPALLAAYRRAKDTAGAANPEIDRMLSDPW